MRWTGLPNATLSGIEFAIKGDTTSAVASIDRLQKALSKLQKVSVSGLNLGSAARNLRKFSAAIKNINTEKLAALSKGLRSLSSIGNLMGKIGDDPAKYSQAFVIMKTYLQDIAAIDFTNLETAAKSLKAIAANANKISQAGDGAKKTASGIKDVGNAAKKANNPISNFMSSLKRIAFYRIIRGIIKGITQAFQEGLKNAYQFSKATGDGAGLAGALDRLATTGMTMKNQLGAAFGGLLTAITPIVVQIINLVTKLAEAISRLFAIMNGSSTYLKAKEVWTDWGEAAAGAGGAAKKALEYLAPFDELNVLPDPKSGGGGGSASNWGDMFEYADAGEGFLGQMLINLKDVLFDWDGLTPEDIAKKAIVGLGAFLGAGAGFLIGGVPGAVVGTIVGVSLALAFNTAVFNNDGVISKSEIASMVAAAASALAGGAIGFVVGGPGGALIGASIGLGLEFVIEAVGLNAGDNPLLAAFLPGTSVGQLQGIPIQSQLELFGTWFKDNFCRGIAQGAIDLINGIITAVQNAVNNFISNHPKLAHALGFDEPVTFRLIPDLEPPVGTFYEEKKREIEAKSQQNPFDFKAQAQIDRATVAIPEAQKMTTGWTAQHEKVSRKWASGLSWTTTGWWAQHEKTSRKWASGLSWTTTGWTAQHSKTERKWNSNLSWTTTGWTAQINKYTVANTLKDNNGNLKVDTTLNVTKVNTNGKLNGLTAATGGVFSNGFWKSIPQYASGGTPHGSLFLAGEAGAELVGHIGGRTEVLNRSQLAATMYAAVNSAMRGVQFRVSAPSASNVQTSAESEDMMYRAFSRALADSDLGGDIELDGNVLYRAMVQRNRQNTRVTGVNAMA